MHSLGRRVEDHISEHDALHNRNSNQLGYGPGLTPHSEVPRSIPSETLSHPSPTLDSQWQPNGHSREHRLPEPTSIRSAIDAPAPDLAPRFQRPRAYTSTAISEHTQPLVEAELPPYDLVYNLVDLFFKHINPWSPILDRKSTFDTLFGGSRLTETDRVLLHAIVAVTLRFSTDPRLTPESRQRYHDSCKTKILLHGIQYPSIEALQALLILAIDLIGISCDGSGMNLLALISRNIVHLGLGIERAVYLGPPSYHPTNTPHHFTLTQPRSWIEEEGRRRLVWMVYILDRYTTVSTCSTFVFSDTDMDRRLPCTYDLFSRNQPVSTRWPHITQHLDSLPSQPEQLGSFSYHCEVLTILSRVHNFLRRPLDLHSPSSLESWRSSYTTLDAELNAWLAGLPGEYGKISQLCHSDPGSKISNWIMLHAAFVTAVIRLHSAAAYPTAISPIFTPSFNAMQRCLGAVESLREIAQDTINNSMLDLLGPPFAFSLWTSAKLLLVHAATVDNPTDQQTQTQAHSPNGPALASATGNGSAIDIPKISFFITTLSAMATHWRLAAIYADTLTRVLHEGQQAARAAAAGTPSTAKTFKEMRKNAYELSVLLAKRAESGNSSVVREPAAHEMEYLDVFEFFNYPLIKGVDLGADGEKRLGLRVNGDDGTGSMMQHRERMENGNGNGMRRLESPSFVMPTRESDWLGFQPPHE
jgi:Fungal specific transcription factor domain